MRLFRFRHWIGCAEQDFKLPWPSLLVGHGHVAGQHKRMVPVKDCLLAAETNCLVANRRTVTVGVSTIVSLCFMRNYQVCTRCVFFLHRSTICLPLSFPLKGPQHRRSDQVLEATVVICMMVSDRLPKATTSLIPIHQFRLFNCTDLRLIGTIRCSLRSLHTRGDFRG